MRVLVTKFKMESLFDYVDEPVDGNSIDAKAKTGVATCSLHVKSRYFVCLA